MVSFGFVLLIVGVCFYIGMLYINSTILLLGYALCLLTLVSILELLVRLFTVKCDLEIPISMAEQNMPVTVNVRIKNRMFLPIGKVRVHLGVRNQLETRSKRQWFDLYGCKQGTTKQGCKVVLKSAGCHEIDISQMRIYSLSGLFYIKKKCKLFGSVLVMPEIHTTGIRITEGVRNFLGDADVYDDFRPGHDPGETFEIREYREKDRLQSVYWKLSARTEQLMIKENSLPKACAVVLMLDLHDGIQEKHAAVFTKWKQLKKMQTTENAHTGKRGFPSGAYLEIIASISYCLMDNKCPHFAVWYSREKEDIRRIRIDDEESFYLFLDVYLREAAFSGKDIRQEYRDKYKSEWYLHDICVNENLEIRKNGELVTKLDEKKIVDECEQMELLL